MNEAQTRWNETRAQEILAPFLTLEGGLLPALKALQAEFGFIAKDAIAVVAHAFNLSRADVYGVVTFYHDLREQPAGRHVLKLCRAEACQAVGADRLAEDAKTQLKLDWHQTSADGMWTLEPVFCLGLCALGPTGMIDGEPVARLDAEKISRLIAPGKS